MHPNQPDQFPPSGQPVPPGYQPPPTQSPGYQPGYGPAPQPGFQQGPQQGYPQGYPAGPPVGYPPAPPAYQAPAQPVGYPAPQPAYQAQPQGYPPAQPPGYLPPQQGYPGSASPDVVVKPSAKVYFRGVGARLLITIPVLAFVVLFGWGRRTRGMTMETRLIIALVTLAVIGLIVVCLLFLPIVRVTSTEVTVRNAVGFTKRYARADIPMAVMVQQYRAANTPGATPMLVLVTAKNTLAMRLVGAMWSKDSMDRVLAALQPSRVDVVQEVMNAKSFDIRYPKLLPAIERRPILFALIIAGGILGLIFGAIAVYAAIN